MIPTYDVLPDIEIGPMPAALSAYEVVDGFSDTRDYEPFVAIGWAEAQQCVRAEGEWLRRAADAGDAADYDVILSEAPDLESPDQGDVVFGGLDVGVAGLVMVLAAAGYATCYSCRGHPGLVSVRCPQVRFNADERRIRMLADRARRLGCGVESADVDYGLATVYARSVPDLHALAVVILADRESFDVLPSPPWRARALEALAGGEEFEWRDDEL